MTVVPQLINPHDVNGFLYNIKMEVEMSLMNNIVRGFYRGTHTVNQAYSEYSTFADISRSALSCHSNETDCKST